MSKGIKACPFCGGKAYTRVVSQGHTETAYIIGAEIGCKTCAFHMRADTVFTVDEFMNMSMQSDGIEHMIENWNRRADNGKDD